jgi:hypothetical protein
MMQNSEICEQAIEVIEKYGWHRDGFGSDLVGYCLAGSLARVGTAIRENWWDNPCGEAQRLLGPVIPEGLNVPALNDRVLSCQEEAIDVLTMAAKHWRDQGR